MDRKKDAVEYYQQGLSALYEKPEKAAVSYTRAIKFDEKNLQYHLGVALAKGEQENSKSACTLYKVYLTMDPQNALAYYNLGFILDVLGNIDESIEMYKKSLECDPNDVDGYYNLAIMLTTREDYEEAEKHYLKALELQPSNANKTLNCLGYSYFLQGEFEKARTELQKSLALDGKYLFAYCNMSLILFSDNKPEEARKFFEEGVKIFEGDQSAQRKIMKDIIASYTGERVRLEKKLSNNEEEMDEAKITLLQTVLNGLVNMISLLTQQHDSKSENES